MALAPTRRARASAHEGGITMDRDEIKGKGEKAKGFVKEKAGELTNNAELEAEGKMDRASGAVQEGFGKAKRKVKEGINEVTDRAEDRDDRDED
jgi:uncharacterized protein YjbJ (UPF0337 family)